MTTALGVYHHGDPRWFDKLEQDEQASVLAILHIQQSDSPLRFYLPIPLSPHAMLDTQGKIQRPRAKTGVRVRTSRGWEQADAETAQRIAPAVDAMKRQEMLKKGSTAEGISFWFGGE